MSKETAKKLITEVQTNEELKAKIEGITDRSELMKIAAESGYDVTMEEFEEAEREYRRERARGTDEKLSFDDLEAVAGGACNQSQDAPDGHEMGCNSSYYSEEDCYEKGYYCTGDNFTKDYLEWFVHRGCHMGGGRS